MFVSLQGFFSKKFLFSVSRLLSTSLKIGCCSDPARLTGTSCTMRFLTSSLSRLLIIGWTQIRYFLPVFKIFIVWVSSLCLRQFYLSWAFCNIAFSLNCRESGKDTEFCPQFQAVLEIVKTWVGGIVAVKLDWIDRTIHDVLDLQSGVIQRNEPIESWFFRSLIASSRSPHTVPG